MCFWTLSSSALRLDCAERGRERTTKIESNRPYHRSRGALARRRVAPSARVEKKMKSVKTTLNEKRKKERDLQFCKTTIKKRLTNFQKAENQRIKALVEGGTCGSPPRRRPRPKRGPRAGRPARPRPRRPGATPATAVKARLPSARSSSLLRGAAKIGAVCRRAKVLYISNAEGQIISRGARYPKSEQTALRSLSGTE